MCQERLQQQQWLSSVFTNMYRILPPEEVEKLRLQILELLISLLSLVIISREGKKKHKFCEMFHCKQPSGLLCEIM